MRALILALALASCSSAPPPELPPPQLPQRTGVDPLVEARTQGVVFRAIGAGFVFDLIRDNRAALVWGDQRHTFENVATRIPAYRGTVYDAQTEHGALLVEVRDTLCRDALEPDHVFPHRVTVTFHGETRRGCGRPL